MCAQTWNSTFLCNIYPVSRNYAFIFIHSRNIFDTQTYYWWKNRVMVTIYFYETKSCDSSLFSIWMWEVNTINHNVLIQIDKWNRESNCEGYQLLISFYSVVALKSLVSVPSYITSYSITYDYFDSELFPLIFKKYEYIMSDNKFTLYIQFVTLLYWSGAASQWKTMAHKWKMYTWVIFFLTSSRPIMGCKLFSIYT